MYALKQVKPKTPSRQILLPLVLFAVCATVLSLWLNLSLFISAILFCGLPAVYFTIRLKGRNFWRILLFSVLIATTIGPILDYLALVNNAWAMPHPLLPFHILGPVTLDDCLWLFFYVWGITTIFEATSKQSSHPLGRRFYGGLLGLILVTAIGYAAIGYFPEQVRAIPYIYLLMNTIVLAAPLVLFLKSNPRHRKDFVRFTLYLLPSAFLNEIVSLKLEQWSFPGSAELLGRLPFIAQALPIEELFFITLAAPAIMTYYVYLLRDPQQRHPSRHTATRNA